MRRCSGMEGHYSRWMPQSNGRITPIRPRGWDMVASQLPVFTSTPLVSKTTSIGQLLEWEVSAVMDRTPTSMSSCDRFISVTPPSRCIPKRLPNRRLLDTSNVSWRSDSPSSGFCSMARSSQKSADPGFSTPLCESKEKIRMVRNGARHKALVKKFTVPKTMLLNSKMTNTKRIRL